MRLLSSLLGRFIRNGQLILIDHKNNSRSFGSGQNGPVVTVRLHDAKIERELFFNPELKAAEAYMDGRLTIENGGTAYDFLKLFSSNRTGLAAHPVQRVLRKVWYHLRRIHQAGKLAVAEKNVRHHYDIPPEFYQLWLDPSMNYSCAYFKTPDVTLEQAQIEKMRHIAAKLHLEPGMTVAEIGSGWGGLATFLARNYRVHVTSVTLSPEQVAIARQRAVDEAVADLVTFHKLDYRELTGTFDRVISVGMMEHVGIAHFDTYFAKVKSLLKPGGFAMIHAISRMSPPGTTAPFIRKYIFPGGYVPAMSEVFASLERTGLWCADSEMLRLHYYWTIRHWRENYEAIRPQAVTMMGERFCRMWDFYLASVELGFLDGSNFVFQLLLSDRRDAVPVTRDYITDEDRRLAAMGAK